MPLSLFLLSPCQLKGGNFTTIARIRSHLQKHGHTCVLLDPLHLETVDDINSINEKYEVDLVIGIHAFHTGRYMKDSKVPFILIVGGTDVNEFSKDDKVLTVMNAAVYNARFVVTFSDIMQQKTLDVWPTLNPNKITVIQQAVVTSPSSFCLQRHIDGQNGIEMNEEMYIFLFVGAIRPVKAPLYLVDTFSDWHKENHQILFVIIGPVADEEYFQSKFQPAIMRSKGIIHICGLPSEDTHAAMKQSFALVNSSESEGMSLAILEAMQLGLPVLARDVPGNSSIVTDGETGLLFRTPQEFRKKADILLENASQYERVVSLAKGYVLQHHNLEQEEAAYIQLVNCSVNSSTAE